MTAPQIRKRHRVVDEGAQSPVGSALKNEFVAKLVIEDRRIESLKLAERKLRKHGEKKIVRLMGSIRTFGLNAPIIVDQNLEVIDGQALLEAAKRLGYTEVPTLMLEHLTKDQLRAYRVGVNKLCEGSPWIVDELKAELLELSPMMLLEEIDPEAIGFLTAEFDLLTTLDPAPADDVEDIEPAGASVTRLGDLWVLGEHQIHCADALKKESYQTLMGAEKARMVFTDCPFNVPVNGHVSGLGKVKHREFAMASGEMSNSEFAVFLETYMTHAAAFSVDGGIGFHCMDWRHIAPLILAGERAYGQPLKQLVVWNKTNGGMGAFYRSKHELISVFKVGKAPHVNTFELGQNGRTRHNVWDYAGANTFRKGRDEDLAAHPTVKPVPLVMDAIKDVSRQGEIVLDMFAGSGTTILAAEKTRRRARCLELDPLYVDVAIRRWQKLTGKEAILEATGETFAQRSVATGEHDLALDAPEEVA